MTYTTIEVHDLNDLLSKVRQQDLRGNIVFRGLSRSSYQLVPSLFRDIDALRHNLTGTWQKLEVHYHDSFRIYADSRLPPTLRQGNDRLALICYARHFGLPVRLLDWTQNPLAALFFAVDGEPEQSEDAFVWEYRAKRFTRGLPSFQDLDTYARDHGGVVLIPARHNVDRLTAQSGMFTFHGLPEGAEPFTPLEERPPQGPDHVGVLRRFVIPNTRRAYLKAELAKVGVHRFSLFPDLDGLCVHLKWLATHEPEQPPKDDPR